MCFFMSLSGVPCRVLPSAVLYIYQYSCMVGTTYHASNQPTVWASHGSLRRDKRHAEHYERSASVAGIAACGAVDGDCGQWQGGGQLVLLWQAWWVLGGTVRLIAYSVCVVLQAYVHQLRTSNSCNTLVRVVGDLRPAFTHSECSAADLQLNTATFVVMLYVL